MLSGYVLGRAYGRAVDEGRIGPVEFLGRRVARIWPAHLIVLGVMAAVVAGGHFAGFDPHHAHRFDVADFLPQALLVQAWGDVGGWGWNLPTWSLSALVACYAIFPGVWGMIGRMKLPVMIAAAVGAVALSEIAARLTLNRGLFDLPFYLGVARALPMFFTGMVLARWVERAPLPAKPSTWLGILAGVLLVVLQLVGRFDALSFGLIAAIILCAGSVPVGKPRPLVEAAGKLSFSLFITHSLVSTVWFGVLHFTGEGEFPVGFRWVLWGASLPAALVFAWAFDRLVDQPVQTRLAPLLKKAFSRRPVQYPAPAPSA